MDQIIFIGSIAVLISISLFWGFKHLPGEKWQILAALPRKKQATGNWDGLNLTYYGLLSANAYTFAVVMFFILGASVNIPVRGLCLLIIVLLSVCMPAAKIVARIVEKKQGTLTVGGAVFIGTLAAPWLIFLINQTLGHLLGFHMNLTLVLSAICVAYSYGEGLGRLACVSFGCCYGKPLHQCPFWIQKCFGRFYLVFSGQTKKIAYASGLEGEKVIPIQIITAALYCTSALAGTWLFLEGFFALALVETIVVTQVWRIVSEFFRADFRGSFKVTPYQLMAAGGLVYSLGVVNLFPATQTLVQLREGLTQLWNPWMILGIQVVWIAAFLYTGQSSVTGSKISFHVNHRHI
jgi:hypothetical protein